MMKYVADGNASHYNKSWLTLIHIFIWRVKCECLSVYIPQALSPPNATDEKDIKTLDIKYETIRPFVASQFDSYLMRRNILNLIAHGNPFEQ